ncbi:hypothetical protein FOL46_000374 [Perkinsus olseni]|uniref:Cytochrome P450 n=1 Tax=Perkinsus olseni TaxID=32597 RepID=A0A7J6MIL4_PEROL|nr:hypothetical protein FOL46_000374 [Perkinsus olseni]
MLPVADALLGLFNKVGSLARSRLSPRLLASGIAVVAAVYLYRAIRRRRRRPSLCDRFGGTPGPIPYFGFVPRSAEHFVYALEIMADTYGDAYAINRYKQDDFLERCFRIMGRESVVLTDCVTVSTGFKKIAESVSHFVEGAAYVMDRAGFQFITRNHFPWNLDPMIRSRRAEGGECRRSDLLSKLLQLDKRALEGNIVTILFAGTETTSAALAWSLYYLCLYPDAQARAREEVDTLGRDPDIDDDLDKLPFVESCILETLRLKSPAPVIVNETIANVSVCGHEVPVGSWIVALTGKQMRSNAEGGSFFR